MTRLYYPGIEHRTADPIFLVILVGSPENSKTNRVGFQTRELDADDASNTSQNVLIAPSQSATQLFDVVLFFVSGVCFAVFFGIPERGPGKFYPIISGGFLILNP